MRVGTRLIASVSLLLAGCASPVAVTAIVSHVTVSVLRAAESAGQTEALSVTPDTGYTLPSSVGGTCPAGAWSNNVYTTGTLQTSCTVSFSATANTFQVTPSGDGWETISPGAGALVSYGATLAFAVTPVVGELVSTNVTGTCPTGTWAGIIYTTGAITFDCTVLFSATQETFQVSASGDLQETITPATTQTVVYGHAQAFVLAPVTGDSVSTTVGGTCPVGGWSATNFYTTGAITSTCNVTFSASPNTYQVTGSGDGGETITPGTMQTVSYGHAQVFTVNANTGYTASTTVGGTCPAGSWSGPRYTTGPITANCTAAFGATLNSYQLTVSGDSQEMISPSGPQTVSYGHTQSFIVTPDAGDTVSTNVGGTCPAGSWSGAQYTTGVITSACSVTFSATVNSYQVSISGDSLETITPDGTQLVSYGHSQAFTVTTNPGYSLSSTVGGNCPAGSWSGSVYTTGPIVQSCNLVFSAACSNTNESSLPIAASGWVAGACNAYRIQGAWYCYADDVGTSDCVAGAPPYSASPTGMCLSGTTSIAAGAYGAGIGLQLNASGGETSTESGYDATGNSVVGFEITISGDTGGVALRLNLTGSASPSDTQPFVDLPGAGTYQVLLADAVVPGSFPGASAGTRANLASLYDIQLAIPATVAVAYDFCITALKPILSGSVTMPTTCSTPASFGPAVCGPQDLLGEVGAYAIQNNLNGISTAQCVQPLVGGACGGFTVTYPEDFTFGGDSPSSYPSIIYGWQAGSFYGGYQTAKQLSAIHSIPTTWEFTTPASGKWDAAYDIWFSPDSAPATAAGGVELMIWPNWGNAQPSGSMMGTTTIASTGSWEVWKSSITVENATWQYIAYRKNPGSDANLSFDIKDFATDAIGEDVGLSTSSYLLGVQAGFEVWSASQGNTMGTTSFSALVH